MNRNPDIDTDAFQSIGSIVGKMVDGMKRDIAYQGGKITRNGVYRNVPMSVYHSDCCDGPSISSSGLREIAPPDGCPLKFWDNSYLNPDRAPEEPKDHFNLGKAVHTLLLGEDGFRDEFVIRPEEFPDYKTKAAREWRDAQIAAGKTVLLPSALEQIEGMADRVARDQTFIDLLRGDVERSVIYKDQKTGVWVKTRPDSIPTDNVIADLKTTSDASDRGCALSVRKFNYHMQLALAGTAIREVRGVDIRDHVLLFIEPKRPYAYNIKPIDAQYIELGARQNRAALNAFAECWNSGFWPTYWYSGVTISPTDQFEKMIENEPSIPKAA
ncbi:PD-(D/E)XK nuclease-like domain-containing protein [Shinella sumterensis]|uniref:PD-(D/E)XK nuclease-like domain-containing protein n=1 Tax=Shinella sumterensis TaxID=1967501 RepID=UPI001E4B672C|nr:PD-(D/E)XK nuclease-like domain-containing protein [Shinella sumterensis]